MSSGSSLSLELSERTFIFGLKVWVLIGIIVGVFIILILSVIPICLTVRKKYKRALEKLPLIQIHPAVKEIKEVNVEHVSANNFIPFEGILLTIHDKSSNRNSDKVMIHLGMDKIRNADNSCQFGSFNYMERDGGSQSGEGGSSQAAIVYRPSSSVTTTSLLTGLPEFSQLGWGHWFTLRDLELATNCFSRENILGEGGYGIVYHGQLSNGTPVAVKRILNNLGQAENEFRVEVDAIGHVRHRNLVRLLGYCMEGTQRILVYEYVNNGNLEQWLHGAMCQRGYLTWEARMKILLGTAKALSYLHEAIEPKVVHRDIKSSNILIDENFDAKVSDFGMAKLLGSGESHITTRVMGTFGYVAPEYANTGFLNEKSDIYSFGVVLFEAITGRDPVNHDRPADEKQDYHAQDATVGKLISSVQCFFPTECTSLIGSRFINVLATVLAFDLPELQVNLVDWVKIMVGCRRSEEVVDPKIEARPSTRALKRALLIALRCIDPDSDKRPKMSRVVRFLESEEYPFPHEDRQHGRVRADGIMDVESQKENSDTDRSNNPG